MQFCGEVPEMSERLRSIGQIRRLSMIEHLVKAAARLWQVSPSIILGPRRTRQASRPRFAVAYVAMACHGIPSAQVALALGNRDRSTIEVAVRRAHVLRTQSAAFADRLAQLELIADQLFTYATAMEVTVEGLLPVSTAGQTTSASHG